MQPREAGLRDYLVTAIFVGLNLITLFAFMDRYLIMWAIAIGAIIVGLIVHSITTGRY